jgi:integrase
MPRQKSIPAYQHHKPSGQAFVRFTTGGVRRVVYLGKHDTPESRTEYRRIIAELETAGPTAVAAHASKGELSVNQLLLAFLKWAATNYRNHDGKPTNELDHYKRSAHFVRELYGLTPAKEFGPKALAAVRNRMVGSGWCRTLVNRRTDRVKRMFKWAASQELIPATTYQALRTLEGLRRGRTEAHETEPIRPADPAHVAATLPYLDRHVRVMVEVQRLTGMRPCEVCKLTLGEVDCSGELWVYRPANHKTAHHGRNRLIPLGPRAQAVLVAFLIGDKPPPEGFDQLDLSDHTARLVAADAYQEAGREQDARLLRNLTRPVAFVAGCVVDPAATVFSPWEAREERFRLMRANRKSKVQPSQLSRRATNPKRPPGLAFTTTGYDHAVAKAACRAGVPHWHPNQLRHLFATEVRKAHGLEAAQVLLGHAKADITQLYAERDLTLASAVAAKIG